MTLGIEPPEVGGADQLVAVHHTLGFEMAPLVRAPGIAHGGTTRRGSPHHELPVFEIDGDDATAGNFGGRDERDPHDAGW